MLVKSKRLYPYFGMKINVNAWDKSQSREKNLLDFTSICIVSAMMLAN